MVVLMAIPPDRNMHSDKPSPSTSDGRKSSKPIMEKRRRARINASLTELKSLLLEVIKKEGTRYNKMEKADILEMTVKHLRQLQRQQFTGSPKTDSNVLSNYRCGFDKCAQEVTSYLAQMEVCDVDLRSRILSHLANCVSSGIFNPSPPSTPVSVIAQSMSPPSQACVSTPTLPLPSIPASLSQPLIYNQLPLEEPSRNLDFNTYTSLAVTGIGASQPVQMTKVVSGVQVIPTKLHTGEIAFVLPGNVLSSGGQVPSYIIPVYPSQATDIPQLQTIASATVTSPAVISPLPFIHAGQDTPKSHTVPDVLLSSVPRQFVNVTTGHHSVVQTPTISPYRHNVAMLTPRPTPPSSTVTSQRLPIVQRPLLIQDANQDQNHVLMPRPDPQRDDSMWRPW